MKKPALPPLSRVKKALYADWTLRVKQADGWKCLLCGCEDNLAAHHWYVCDHHAHAARYCVHNGATLCYACHIRGVHQRADWLSVSRVSDIVRLRPNFDVRHIELCMETELTTEVLRKLWDGMRSRVIETKDYTVIANLKGGKLFLTPETPHPIAVVGNLMDSPGFGVCEVTVVYPSGKHFRYTLKPLEEDCKRRVRTPRWCCSRLFFGLCC